MTFIQYTYIHTYIYERDIFNMNILNKKEWFLLWGPKSDLATISDIKEFSSCLKLAFWGQKSHKKHNWDSLAAET